MSASIAAPRPSSVPRGVREEMEAMREARQPDTHQRAAQAGSAGGEVMRLLEDALNRYVDIMEVADLEDGLDADAPHPEDYSLG